MAKSEKEKNDRISVLEEELSSLRIQLEDYRFQYESEAEKRRFYQLIADFAFGWELWFGPDGSIKYCSPSCYDLTGFTSNEILVSDGIAGLLVYEADRENYAGFLRGALNQSLVNQALEFRILTRTRQLRWFLMSVRGVYDQLGRYLGIRASVQDVTRLKRAMGHISDLERSKEFDQRNKQRLQSQIDVKDRELVSFLLQLSQKNETLNKASRILAAQSPGKTGTSEKALAELKKLIGVSSGSQIDWNTVENQVERVHPGFLGRLKARHSLLTAKDTRLCAYVRLGLSSREIAGLLNLTPQSVEISRVRLRKKLKLSSEIRLMSYLLQL